MKCGAKLVDYEDFANASGEDSLEILIDYAAEKNSSIDYYLKPFVPSRYETKSSGQIEGSGGDSEL